MLILQQAFPAKETKQSSIVCLQSCWIFGESFQFKYVRSIWPIFAFTDVTNCDGKATCFQKLMIAKPQASLPVLPVCKRRGSWQTQLSLPNCHPRNPTKLTDAEPLHLKRFSCPASTFYTDRASFAEKGVGCIMSSNSSSRKSHFAAIADSPVSSVEGSRVSWQCRLKKSPGPRTYLPPTCEPDWTGSCISKRSHPSHQYLKLLGVTG